MTWWVSLILLCFVVSGYSQNGDKMGTVKINKSERRLALVIGNLKYFPLRELSNTERDADSMKVVLETLGFQVWVHKNLDYKQMSDAFYQFKNQLKSGDVVVVYFSGHGIGFDGKNYLLPTDTEIQCFEQLEDYGRLTISTILSSLKVKEIKNCFVFLDACRNLGEIDKCPTSNTKGGSIPKGLFFPKNNPEGVYIVFATQEGSTADDDKYNKINSLFTAELIKNLRIPNLSHRRIIDETAIKVKAISNQTQRPEKYDGIDGDYYFLIDEKQKKLSSQVNPIPIKKEITPKKSQNGSVRKDLTFGPEVVFIEGGTLSMGSSEGDVNEKPVHKVNLSGFWIGKYEITVTEYMQFANETNSHYPEWFEKGNQYYINTDETGYYSNRGYLSPRSNLPIVGISWDDAVAYCEWLTQKTNKKYRLPTEAEWEYTSNEGNQSKGMRFSGSNEINEVGWVGENSDNKVHIVGTKKPNSLGIYDLTGNVWEWCADWYAPYKNEILSNPLNLMGDKKYKVVRGGSFGYSKDYARNTFRSPVTPSTRYDFTGFRVVTE